MDSFIWIIIIGALLSVAGWIIWLVFFVWVAKKTIESAEEEFNRMLFQLEGALRDIPQEGSTQLNSQQQNQIKEMLRQAQTQMGQLDDLQRQRYENRVGDLMGMASNAGIDWNPYY